MEAPSERQRCTGCGFLVGAAPTDDDLRVRGWLVYDGESLTGKPLHVRQCPLCQEKSAKALSRRSATARRKASLRAVQPPLV